MQGKSHYLKSTGQQVFLMGWTAQAARPWSNEHEQVLRPRLPGEFTKSGDRGEVMIVRKDSLTSKSPLAGQ